MRPALIPVSRRVAVGLAVAGAVAVPLVATPASAQAAACTAKPTVVATHLDGGTVVLGTGNIRKADLYAQIDEHGCAVSKVTMRFAGPGFGSTFTAEKLAPADASGRSVWGVEVSFRGTDLRNTDAGRWHTTIAAVNSLGTASKAGPDFSVKRAATLGTDASPEPVRKGRTITVKGTLRRTDWQRKANVGYAQQKVTLQWRSSAKGSSYHTLKTVTTGSGGALKTTVKAGHDGCYRFVYAGSSTTAPVNGGSDCVDVR